MQVSLRRLGSAGRRYDKPPAEVDGVGLLPLKLSGLPSYIMPLAAELAQRDPRAYSSGDDRQPGVAPKLPFQEVPAPTFTRPTRSDWPSMVSVSMQAVAGASWRSSAWASVSRPM